VSTVDLSGELFTAQCDVTDEHRRKFLRAGIPAMMIHRGFVGVTRALTEKNCYQPIADGRELVMVPARVASPISPETSNPALAIGYGDVVDIVAFSLEAPSRWWLRTGSAQWLGACSPQYLTPDPVFIRKTPLAWLQASGDGLVVLRDEPRETQWLLLPLRRIAVADHVFGRKLKRFLELPATIPQIFVTAPERVL
jgi:hypothetical protein